MNIFFWQNCISPHQVPYIRRTVEDCRVNKVFLIAPRIDYDERKEMGWDAGKMLGGVAVEWYIAPSAAKMDELMSFEPQRSIHLFSGIRGDYETYRFFLHSLKYQLKRGFIQEPPYTYNKPLWAHYVRFFLQDRKYISKFDYVFAIGEDAVSYFRSWSSKWKVIPFIYCTEKPDYIRNGQVDSEYLSLVFVGSLSKRKNLIVLLKALSKLSDISKVKLTVYGDGDLRGQLEKIVNTKGLSGVVSFIGKVDMEQVPRLMQEHDVLVLPSLYDGWGAVINEALMSGLYCICSDRCGARLLLRSSERGLIFKNNNSVDLRDKIECCIEKKSHIRASVSTRRQWSKCIDGISVAEYMIDNLIQKELSVQPWI